LVPVLDQALVLVPVPVLALVSAQVLAQVQEYRDAYKDHLPTALAPMDIPHAVEAQAFSYLVEEAMTYP
jgi:hypothetical protein